MSMQTAVYLRSLCPGTPVYAWTSGRTWEALDPARPLPSTFFLANQVGIQVGCFVAVDIDSFQSFLGGLEYIHRDLYLDAVQKAGLRNFAKIHPKRWERLICARPVKKLDIKSRLTLYALDRDGTAYRFQGDNYGKGGWFKIDKMPNINAAEEFNLWDYTITVPQHEGTVCVPANCCKKLVTSTFDCLYKYDLKDASLCSYLAYAQPLMTEMWKKVTPNEG